MLEIFAEVDFNFTLETCLELRSVSFLKTWNWRRRISLTSMINTNGGPTNNSTALSINWDSRSNFDKYKTIFFISLIHHLANTKSVLQDWQSFTFNIKFDSYFFWDCSRGNLGRKSNKKQFPWWSRSYYGRTWLHYENLFELICTITDIVNSF